MADVSVAALENAKLSRHLHLAAVDIIIDSDNRWHLIEINDQPGGLAAADALPFSAGLSSSEKPLSVAAEEMVAMAGSRCICLLLSDRFDLSGSNRSGALHPTASVDPAGLETIGELNRLAFAIRQKGGVYLFATQDDFSSGRLSDIAFGVIFRRAGYPCLPKSPPYAVINNYAVREICLSKKNTYDVLRNATVKDRLIPTFFGGSYDDFGRFMARYVDRRTKYIVLKADRGARSKHVFLLPIERAYRSDCLKRLVCVGRLLMQPYIVPKLLKGPGGHGYVADIRLFLWNGRVIGGLVRRAAAAVTVFGLAHRASWLPTTGSIVGLSEASETRYVDEHLLDEMKTSLAEAACCLDGYVRRALPSLDRAYRASYATYFPKRAKTVSVRCCPF